MGRTLIGVGMYEMGYKYCSRCGYWFATKEIRCPCCHLPLRTRACVLNRKVKRY